MIVFSCFPFTVHYFLFFFFLFAPIVVHGCHVLVVCSSGELVSGSQRISRSPGPCTARSRNKALRPTYPLYLSNSSISEGSRPAID
jgi:hypothetical protein